MTRLGSKPAFSGNLVAISRIIYIITVAYQQFMLTWVSDRLFSPFCHATCVAITDSNKFICDTKPTFVNYHAHNSQGLQGNTLIMDSFMVCGDDPLGAPICSHKQYKDSPAGLQSAFVFFLKWINQYLALLGSHAFNLGREDIRLLILFSEV